MHSVVSTKLTLLFRGGTMRHEELSHHFNNQVVLPLITYVSFEYNGSLEMIENAKRSAAYELNNHIGMYIYGGFGNEKDIGMYFLHLIDQLYNYFYTEARVPDYEMRQHYKRTLINFVLNTIDENIGISWRDYVRSS